MSTSSVMCRLLPEDQQRFDEALEVDPNPKTIRKFLEKIAHNYVSTGENGLYTCPLHETGTLGYSTKNMSDARRHFFGHFPEGFQQCDVCGHRTSQVTNLRNHIRTQHPTHQDILIKKTSRRISQDRPRQAFKRHTTSKSTAYSTGQSEVRISQRVEITQDLPPLPALTYSTPSPASSTDVELPITDLDLLLDFPYTNEDLLRMFYAPPPSTVTVADMQPSLTPLSQTPFDPALCLNAEPTASKQVDPSLWDPLSTLFTSSFWCDPSFLQPFPYLVSGLTQDC